MFSVLSASSGDAWYHSSLCFVDAVVQSADAFWRQENLVVIVARVYSADMDQESWLLGGKLCTAWSQLSLGKP